MPARHLMSVTKSFSHVYHHVAHFNGIRFQMTEGLSVGESDSDAAAVGYNIIHVKTTNVYILVKNNKAKPQTNPCVCSFWVRIPEKRTIASNPLCN